MGRPKKDFAAIAERAAQLSDSHALAQRLDRIASSILDRLEANVKEIKPANLPLAAAIILDKAGQARGAALAGTGHTTVNVQINGLGKDALRAALAGVGDMTSRRRTKPQRTADASTDNDAMMGRCGPVRIGSSSEPSQTASHNLPEPEPAATPVPATDTGTCNSPFPDTSGSVIDVQCVTHADAALQGPAQGRATPANEPQQAGGEGVGDPGSGA